MSNCTYVYVLYYWGNEDLTDDYSLVVYSDQDSGTLSLICELMEMNMYEFIKGIVFISP